MHLKLQVHDQNMREATLLHGYVSLVSCIRACRILNVDLDAVDAKRDIPKLPRVRPAENSVEYL